MYTKKIQEDLDCGMVLTMKVLGGKWKCCILDAIHKGMNRPSAIARYIPEASQRVIEMQLAELLFFGAIEKCPETAPVYPKRTEYRLTSLGESLLPLVAYIDEWGLKNAGVIKARLNELEDCAPVSL
ncbi:DNA-binding HxlR family transcriptional regulator [Chitinophaga terrae (ex Kim and Jung 2007)]|jgi:DNA-binding HxlR family transcriptional regulator|uniref:winged helix-turn-helix transcriptional regulator n=1 Tax=Chitinophaga terrae (ex Kim and Jung 2007) TaxID=408074 RepID=UPI00278A8ABE|nr:helix-turn-helix domain-containing protein [Chitinophaga terrae (ex Kim and Jung 2007)]MDQ0108420.1 DNA-binding HxlR family transcriptional regulator [Chitinophaga terrae (ex Kim and Jung 2007)]